MTTDIEAVAVKAAGCRLNADYWFCEAHDEDGNPPWERCRWTGVLPLLREYRNGVLDDVSDEVKSLGSYEFGGLHYIQNSAVYGAILAVRKR